MIQSEGVRRLGSRHAGVRYVLFFSSRRRHTRYWRDWSSDVCSSDLTQIASSKSLRQANGLNIRNHFIEQRRVRSWARVSAACKAVVKAILKPAVNWFNRGYTRCQGALLKTRLLTFLCCSAWSEAFLRNGLILPAISSPASNEALAV